MGEFVNELHKAVIGSEEAAVRAREIFRVDMEHGKWLQDELDLPEDAAMNIAATNRLSQQDETLEYIIKGDRPVGNLGGRRLLISGDQEPSH